jgi:hypothetical protein
MTMRAIWEAGKLAKANGRPPLDNPHREIWPDGRLWASGYDGEPFESVMAAVDWFNAAGPPLRRRQREARA